MGYRYDMRGKTATQQAIVKQSDKADRIREEKTKKVN